LTFALPSASAPVATSAIASGASEDRARSEEIRELDERARGCERRPASPNHRTNAGKKYREKAIPATSLAKKRKISPVERREPSIEGFQRNPRTTRREIFSRARSKIKKARWIRFEREGGDSSDR
jgi:hypothetical protein